MENSTNPTEARLQQEIIQLAWNKYPETGHHLWAVPNGLFMNKITAKLGADTGLLSGVWDLHFFWRKRFYIFEVKVGTNTLTRDRINKKGKKVYGQFEWGQMMVQHGAQAYIIRSVDEFERALKRILERAEFMEQNNKPIGTDTPLTNNGQFIIDWVEKNTEKTL